jgi:anti-sigma-K factor RskA
MISEVQQEQIIDWLLGTLDPVRGEQIASQVAADPELAVFAQEMHETLDSVALTAPLAKPPADLPQRILRGHQRRNQRIPTFIPWAIAACLAVGLIIVRSERTALQARLAGIERANQLANLRIANLQTQVANLKNTSVTVVWNPDLKAGVVQLDKIPLAGPGKDYQLWVVDPGKPLPINGGVLPIKEDGTVRIEFKPDHPVQTVTKFVISVEPAGGVPKSVGPAVFAGEPVGSKTELNR